MARIPEQEVERLKQDVSVQRLAQARGSISTANQYAPEFRWYDGPLLLHAGTPPAGVTDNGGTCTPPTVYTTQRANSPP